MPPLTLTFAASEYDHFHDLVSGEVAAEGIELNYLRLTIEEIFFRFTRFREWDCYFDARAEDPAERLKALVTHHSGAGAARRTVARRSARSAQHRVLKRTAQLVRDQRPSDAAQPAGWRCQRGGSPASL